ncbi:MAG: RagB/SusD family nutrient uptake outer membrane protein [Cyclobacteriaceae bacterium]
MKKFYQYPSILFIVLFSGCSNLLDIEAENTISGDLYTDTESIQQALTGAYYTFTGISDGATGGELLGGDFIIIPELMARVSPTSSAQEYRWETVLAPSAYRDFVNKDILQTNSRVQANWQRAFEAINTVNNIIANIDKVNDANEKNRIHGEALAIRGVLLFEMVILWAPDYNADGVTPTTTGAFPFRTEPITDINQIEKLSSADIKSIDAVYNQAEEDLIEASNLLEPFGKNGTNLSYYACQGYLAKLNLQKGEYGTAEDYCDEIIDNGPYALMSSPLLAFNNTANSTEDIFAIQQTLANNVGDRSSGFGLTAYFSSLTESGIGVYRPFSNTFTSDSWFNSPFFEDADIRGSIKADADSSTTSSEVNTAYYKSVVDNFAGIVSTAKYMSSSNVLPVLRLAEVHLIRAEANFENLGAAIVSPKALGDLNEIRTRAGISGLLLTDFPDPLAFFDSLVVERTREFMHEGMLLEDLKRWGAYDYLIGRSSNSFHPWDERFVLPIPQSELDTWTD